MWSKFGIYANHIADYINTVDEGDLTQPLRENEVIAFCCSPNTDGGVLTLRYSKRSHFGITYELEISGKIVSVARY